MLGDHLNDLEPIQLTHVRRDKPDISKKLDRRIYAAIAWRVNFGTAAVD